MDDATVVRLVIVAACKHGQGHAAGVGAGGGGFFVDCLPGAYIN